MPGYSASNRYGGAPVKKRPRRPTEETRQWMNSLDRLSESLRNMTEDVPAPRSLAAARSFRATASSLGHAYPDVVRSRLRELESIQLQLTRLEEEYYREFCAGRSEENISFWRVADDIYTLTERLYHRYAFGTSRSVSLEESIIQSHDYRYMVAHMKNLRDCLSSVATYGRSRHKCKSQLVDELQNMGGDSYSYWKVFGIISECLQFTPTLGVENDISLLPPSLFRIVKEVYVRFMSARVCDMLLKEISNRGLELEYDTGENTESGYFFDSEGRFYSLEEIVRKNDTEMRSISAQLSSPLFLKDVIARVGVNEANRHLLSEIRRHFLERRMMLAPIRDHSSSSYAAPASSTSGGMKSRRKRRLSKK